mmetsp:Transcript_15663/g.56229  ORF Transcript_15663/g.56229 Transcript_15663/m.56229 type:complete len:263 (-) Transcript_15663:4000-4788(-)
MSVPRGGSDAPSIRGGASLGGDARAGGQRRRPASNARRAPSHRRRRWRRARRRRRGQGPRRERHGRRRRHLDRRSSRARGRRRAGRQLERRRVCVWRGRGRGDVRGAPHRGVFDAEHASSRVSAARRPRFARHGKHARGDGDADEPSLPRQRRLERVGAAADQLAEAPRRVRRLEERGRDVLHELCVSAVVHDETASKRGALGDVHRGHRGRAEGQRLLPVSDDDRVPRGFARRSLRPERVLARVQGLRRRADQRARTPRRV